MNRKLTQLSTLLAFTSTATLSAQVEFVFNATNIRPDANPYNITISNLGNQPPSVATTDSSGDTPAPNGLFTAGDSGDGSIIITFDGRSDDSLEWNSNTWSGGTPFLIRGNNSGLGITDSAGQSAVDEGEAIIFSFDLSTLTLDAGESVILSGATFSSSSSQLWQLTGTPGSANAGTLVGTGASWTGQIDVSDGSTFALANDGRVRTITLDILLNAVVEQPANLVATGAFGRVELEWDDDTSGGLDFYSVYRSTTSPVDTSGTPLATNSSSNYSDVTAEVGVSYYYAVTATSLLGVESSPSNEALATALGNPLQFLDATDANTITGNPVTAWLDSSTNGNDAAAGQGSVLFPSASLSESGLAGIDLGSGFNSLQLFDSSSSDTWLDFSSSNTGFSLIFAFKCDELVPGIFNYLVGNSIDGSSGFQIGYTSAGQLEARLGSQTLTSPGDLIVPGETILVALNYDAGTGQLELWDSLSYTSTVATVTAADFSTANPVTLGGISGATNSYVNGIIGDLKIFDSGLSANLFKQEREKLLHQWKRFPNIIMVLTDDMAWYDTPVRMDDRMLNSAQEIMRRLEDPQNPGQPYYWYHQQIADQGFIFRNAYSSAPQCTPTRANLQTGQSTARNRVGVFLGGSGRGVEFDTRNRFNNYPMIPNGIALPFAETVKTIPEVLSPFGYESAHYGKWHLGADPSVEGYLESDGNTDNDQGDTFPSGDQQIPDDIEDPKRINELTDKTIAFMTTRQAAGKPFYIQISHYAVHTPWECYPSSRALFQSDPDILAFNDNETDVTELRRKSDPAVFFGMIYDLDQSLGRLMQEIENLGLTDETYIVFKSDNNYRRFNTQNFSQPYFGDKWLLWEGGIRVPMIAKGPGIPAGSISTANVTTYDLLPTFVDWAGGDPGLLTNIDGVSLESLLEGQTPSADFLNRSIYFHYPHYRNSNPFSAIVKGRYKLIHTWDGTIRTDISMSNPNMLFDLSVDPGETNNINTTPNDSALAASLWADLEGYLTSVNAWTPLDNSAAYLADNASDYESDNEYSDRIRYAPFEGARGTGTSQVDYWFDSWGVDIGADSADYDFDGLSNLLEYALGRNPTFAESPEAGGLPTLEFINNSWSFSFFQRVFEGGLNYTVETSPDLSTWTDVLEEDLQVMQSGSDFDWVETILPDGDKRFIRLSVER
ncbi:MAG: sulfatase-like hydrolase/transferase [Verrucomicrobiota bacterium]